ncbi:glycoside hydrolase family 18 protein [Cylindrobasidium torrendii FP15055 ss-10]|uniref:Glycoside hydrolase family 18 protein n=1 Tax=Cylindrobasidium torrendii FP15055 ss-10 TaxID=1314674 RepID=A0A0D7BFN3_9AGAR|nr:glycoside hydrolase family 18 protein [Cylindrobasidium torrendii FP15055 ss-10]
MPPLITINKHTTTSSPRPHILYSVELTRNGAHYTLQKRYSDFIHLEHNLGGTGHALPPKRILTTTFLPSAWIDDALISERKTGLQAYLEALLNDPKFSDSNEIRSFFVPGNASDGSFHPEDAVPSTFSRQTALSMVKGAPRSKAVSNPIAASYYPDWATGTLAPENIDFSKYDILFFAFAMPNQSSGLDWDSGGQDVLNRLVSSARNSGQGTKVVLSVGGWGGSYWFSNAVTNKTNRTTFVQAMADAINNHDLDGVDIDWEYPNSTGAGNPHASEDTANLLKLFKALRTQIGDNKIISSAVTHQPWLGANGSPLTDVSSFAAVMDYVNIMNYDVWGASANPGPNAPYEDKCGTNTQPQATAKAAFASWTNAGFPANKLLLGLPTYGYVSQSTATGLSGSLVEGKKSSTTLIPHPREKKGIKAKADANLQSWYGQQIPFGKIVESGALFKQADGTYNSTNGFTYQWDWCSDTPYIYNVSQSTVVTFDDTASLGIKAQYALESGMAGCFTWSLEEDDGTALQDAVRARLGK